jgi:serine/threonine protein kinase
MSDATPSLVAGRYRLDELIASGPMGEVWRGYDTRADWTVAVKVLDARAAGAATREVLRQHAQSVARVIHPNVAMVLDVGDRDGSPFLVMEYLTGESLGEEAARGPLKIRDVCDLVGQAAAGLDAAHRAGVVHGQIGPDSFRMSASGVLKVVGFGLFDQAVPGDRVRYRAPEVIDGRSGSAAADLYALGCVCYLALCGRPPFEGSPEEVAALQVRAEPAPPGRHRPDVPPELDRLVLAMLAKDPAARPGGGEPVRRALAAIARPRPPVVSPAGQTRAMPAMPAPVFHDGPRSGDTAIYQAPPPADTANRKLFIQLGVALAAIVAVTVGLIVLVGSSGGEEAADSPTPLVTTLPTTAPPTEPSSEPPASPAPSPTDPATLYARTIEPTDGLVKSLRPVPQVKGTLGQSDPPGGWGRWLGEFDNVVSLQERTGSIDPHTARKAHDQIRKAGGRFADGRTREGLDQVRNLARDLDRARQRGAFPDDGPLADFLGDWQI